MKRRRRAETLAEFLIAMLLFSAIMTGVFDFVANQYNNAARTKDYDFFMFWAQRYVNTPSAQRVSSVNTPERGEIEYEVKDGVLTVTQGDKSMKFTISNN